MFEQITQVFKQQPEVTWLYLLLMVLLGMRIYAFVYYHMGRKCHPSLTDLPRQASIPLGMIGTIIGIAILASDASDLAHKLTTGLPSATQTTAAGLFVLLSCFVMDAFENRPLNNKELRHDQY